VAVVPEDPGLLATMFDWVPDEAARHRILVDNPAKLYRFQLLRAISATGAAV
jgi:predicted TIM-barrel fold metal-dependent hydrolase